MSRAEIKRKFDEIVAFSEIEKFLDTPVKRYSSGMYVRLAFAVAAHLEPEILIVDEVLAVGDAPFQKKCLGKMEDIADAGRTALFVSHNVASVQRLCSHCVLLSKGHLAQFGVTQPVISRYLSDTDSSRGGVNLEQVTDRSGNGLIRFTTFHLEDLDGSPLLSVQSGMDFDLIFGYRCAGIPRVDHVDVGFSLHSADTTLLAVLYSSYTGKLFESVHATGTFRCRVRSLPLKEGRYLIGFRLLANGEEADWPRQLVGCLEVLAGDFFGTGAFGYAGSAPLLLNGSWNMSHENTYIQATYCLEKAR